MYALIGKKLGHSFSADFFNKKFKEEGIPEHYELLPIPAISDFPKLLAEYPDLKGINVTIPYKQAVIPFLDELSEEAREIGAVNVIKVHRNDNNVFLKGFNSDVIGFMESLKPLLRDDIKKALILGTGGASKAVAYVLKKLGIKYKFVSRSGKMGQYNYTELNEKIISENILIVNTTPLGMYPDMDSAPPIPYQFLTPAHVCYDLVYNPLMTEFMKRSEEKGAKVKNGIEMLRLQALASWDFWNS